MYINLAWNCRVWEWPFSVCSARFCQSVATLEWIDQQHFAKTKMEYISLPSNLNAIIGITSYYCVILKMVILHRAIKKIQNEVFVFFVQKEQKTVFIQKNKKIGWKKQVGCFSDKSGLFSTLIVFQSFFCYFPLIARSGISHVTISLNGCAPHI